MEDLSTQLSPHVAVIGAGMAGLSCAAQLTRAGIPVSLYEASTQAGGRTRGLTLHNTRVDNGQHIMLGAYRHTLDLLRLCQVDMAQTWQRQALAWRVDELHIPARPRLPYPLNLLGGLISAQGISWRHRWQILRILLGLKALSYSSDVSVATWLIQQGQSDWLIQRLWQPLCLATLNTPIESASAKRFIAVLRDGLLAGNHASDLLLAQQDLDQALVQPVLSFLNQHAIPVHLRHRLTQLEHTQDGFVLYFANARQVHASHVVLALHPAQLKAYSATLPSLQALDQLTYQAITTVYLQYPINVKLPAPMQGFSQGPVQWLFDRGQFAHQAGLMAAVISAHPYQQDVSQEALLQQVQAQLTQAFPALGQTPLWTKVITEKRATWSCDVGVHMQMSKPAPGVWLAGDYLHADYPATIEAAVQSGLDCARQIEAACISR